MSDGMGREPAYLSSHATNRYFIPNWGNHEENEVYTDNAAREEGGAAALGGNDRVNLMNGQIDIDFAVFNIYQYDNANLTGHYTGPMTME